MLTRTEIQRNLLQKLNELCEKANVKYVLHGQAAFLAYYNEPIEKVNALGVMMCQGDAEKIADLLDDDAYYFEDFRTNPKLDGPYMLFGLKDSLDLKNKELNFTRTRHIDNNCIRITIHFIAQPLNKYNRKILKANRKLLKFRSMNDDYEFRDYKSKRKFTNRIFKVVNEDFYNKRIYNFKKRSVSINTWDDIKKYPFVKITGRRRIESDLFDSILPTTIDGIPAYIFEDFERYAIHFYGRNWENKKWPAINRCTSSLISWEEYINDPEVKEIIENMQKNHDLIYQKNSEVSDDRKEIKNLKRQIKMSKSVIYTREEMLEQKDEIVKLYEAGDIEELGIALDPLIRSLSVGIRRGYTYSVDEDIDKIVDSYLREMGREKRADRIIEMRTDV